MGRKGEVMNWRRIKANIQWWFIKNESAIVIATMIITAMALALVIKGLQNG